MSFTDTEYSRALSIINDLRVEKDKLRAELSAALKLADEATALLYRDAKKHEAQLERAQAQLTEATKERDRFSDLVKRAIYNRSRRNPKSTLNWVAVKELFALGSTRATELCQEFSINPHAEVQDREGATSDD